MRIELADPCLVVLIGPSGSGKSTFARRHFRPTEVISSDFCRGLVADDENDQRATDDAFAVLHFIAGRRLAQPRFTVVDTTNVQREARRPLVELARRHDLFAVAIVLDTPEAICRQRNAARADRAFGAHVVRQQRAQLRRSLKGLRREGFNRVWVLRTPEQIDDAEVRRAPLWTDRRAERGPFDVIGDVHGCHAELVALLRELGYAIGADGVTVTPPDGAPRGLRRRLRRPRSRHARRPGARDGDGRGRQRDLPARQSRRQARAQAPGPRRADHARAEANARAARDPPAAVQRAGARLPGRARQPRRARRRHACRCARRDEGGLPGPFVGARARVRAVRRDDRRDRRLRTARAVAVGARLPRVRRRRVRPHAGRRASVAQQHDEHRHRLRLRRTAERAALARARARVRSRRAHVLRAGQALPRANGCRARTASGAAPGVPARRRGRRRQADRADAPRANGDGARGERRRGARGHEPLRRRPALARLPAADDGADGDVAARRPARAPRRGVRRVSRERRRARHLRGEAHGLSGDRGHLSRRRRRAQALRRRRRADRRDLHPHGASVPRRSRRHGGRTEPSARRGRRRRAVGGARDGLARARLRADAVVGQGARSHPAPVRVRRRRRAGGPRGDGRGASAGAARGLDVAALAGAQRARSEHVERYVDAYRRYVWPVQGVADLRLAPFHVLAAQSGVFVDRAHAWHLERCDRLVAADPGWLTRTDRRAVDVTDADSQAAGVAWWERLTGGGGEGMVVKPLGFVAHGRKGLVQPGLKCRGREYLRIIYGPEYADPSQIDRLRRRSLGRKRSLAVREFALGVEALERFVRREPLHRVHECVFAVLALESEPVDPRL